MSFRSRARISRTRRVRLLRHLMAGNNLTFQVVPAHCLNPMPSLFVAHGSPLLAMEGGAWGEALRACALKMPPISAILVCSAHWETDVIRLTSSPEPGIVHDFGGFPEALYALDYPAPGDPDLASRAAGLLKDAGLEAVLDDKRPLDHGAWVPLRYLVPKADVPVVQMSLPRKRTPSMLFQAGQALAPLRKDDVLILGSGGIVHNLSRLDWGDENAHPMAKKLGFAQLFSGGPGGDVGRASSKKLVISVPSSAPRRSPTERIAPAPWALTFQAWVAERLAKADLEGLFGWQSAPGAKESVPSSEHLDPLFVALGAARSAPTAIHEGWQLGSLSLTSYLFP